jgi:hypothetical protein
MVEGREIKIFKGDEEIASNTVEIASSGDGYSIESGESEGWRELISMTGTVDTISGDVLRELINTHKGVEYSKLMGKWSKGRYPRGNAWKRLARIELEQHSFTIETPQGDEYHMTGFIHTQESKTGLTFGVQS